MTLQLHGWSPNSEDMHTILEHRDEGSSGNHFNYLLWDVIRKLVDNLIQTTHRIEQLKQKFDEIKNSDEFVVNIDDVS